MGHKKNIIWNFSIFLNMSPVMSGTIFSQLIYSIILNAVSMYQLSNVSAGFKLNKLIGIKTINFYFFHKQGDSEY